MRFNYTLVFVANLAGVLASNCKGSSRCSSRADMSKLDVLMEEVCPYRFYEKHMPIACISLPEGEQGLLTPTPAGYCVFPKGNKMRGSEVTRRYHELRAKCRRCGSVDTDEGGELTINYVSDVRDKCYGLEGGGGAFDPHLVDGTCYWGHSQ